MKPRVCADFFEKFSALYLPFKEQGRGVDLIERAGIGRDEARNSDLLAWLLDCFGDHGQGAAFLRCVMERMGEDGRAFPAGAESLGRYRTRREISYEESDQSANQRSRVDVEVDGPGFLLFIEVKIDYRETGDQLQRYLDIVRARAGKRPWRLAFLTPDGRKPNDVALHGKVVCLRWADLAGDFLRHADVMPSDSHGTVLIRQFCNHISQL
ncbi:MAG: PD-(D/E)XK nuclease family protein [Desulfovibrio sp.]|nr:PD-(D/E)XK nuclease family protein [Desulfovibrio sp.]